MRKMKKRYFILFAVLIGTLLAAVALFLVFNERNTYEFVSARIEKIGTNPEAMVYSDSNKYLELSKGEYNEIFALGNRALPALEKIMEEEAKDGTRGLRYGLAGLIRQDILNGNNRFALPDKTDNK